MKLYMPGLSLFPSITFGGPCNPFHPRPMLRGFLCCAQLGLVQILSVFLFRPARLESWSPRFSGSELAVLFLYQYVKFIVHQGRGTNYVFSALSPWEINCKRRYWNRWCFIFVSVIADVKVPHILLCKSLTLPRAVQCEGCPWVKYRYINLTKKSPQKCGHIFTVQPQCLVTPITSSHPSQIG